MQKKIDRLKTILGLNVSNATVNTTGAPNLAVPAKPATEPVPASPTLAESIKFKSRIGRLIAEEFGILEAPGDAVTDIARNASGTVQTGDRAEADALWAEISKAMETPGALTPEQRKDVENMTKAFQQFQQNNPLNSPAPTTAVTDPDKKKEPVKTMAPEPNIQAIQNLYNSLGITDNAGKKLNPDGVWGWRTEEAKWNFKKKYPDGSPEAKQVQALADKIAKEFQWRIIPDKNGQTQRIGANSTKDLTALAPGGGGTSAAPAPATATGNVRPQPTLNGKPSTGPKGQEWVKQYGATHNPDGTPKASSGSSQKVDTAPKAKTIPELDAAIKAASDKVTQLAKNNPEAKAELKAAQDALMAIVKEKAQAMAKAEKNPSGGSAYTHQEQIAMDALMKERVKASTAGDTAKVARLDAEIQKLAGQVQARVSESVGFASEELSRIVSLLHHRESSK